VRLPESIGAFLLVGYDPNIMAVYVSLFSRCNWRPSSRPRWVKV
jgi:hypothetical protein